MRRAELKKKLNLGIEAQERVKHTLNMNANNVFVIVFAEKKLMKYVRGNSIT